MADEPIIDSLGESLAAFSAAWSDLADHTRRLFAEDWPPAPSLSRLWDEAHRVAQDAYLPCRGALADPLTSITNGHGTEVQVRPFSLVLTETPDARWLRGSTISDYRGLFLQALSVGASLARVAIASRSAGSTPSELEELCEAHGFAAFSRVVEARERMSENEHRDAIFSARRAIERLTTEVANRFVPSAAGRRFGDAIEILTRQGVLSPETAAFMKTPNVGVWGWMSKIAVHDEHGENEAAPDEGDAQLAIRVAEAVMIRVVQGYTRVNAPAVDDRD